LDRKKTRKQHRWHQIHSEYIKDFKEALSVAERNGWGRIAPHNHLAHDNYVRWLREHSRLFLCPPAFQEGILEEPVDVEALVENAYNKEVREGHRIGLAGQVHFAVCVPCCVFFLYHLFAYLLSCCLTLLFCVHMQRNEFQNYADEGTRILDDTPEGEGESALRKFLKVSTNEINMSVCHHLGVWIRN
jgi:hypothetical protein